ncbi:MAG TPA: serine hydrolase domain-containing protein [Candidatus Sulfotelmatobacter sp.]|nr:serine hydrolase domain-containing protein [Candidatus Sulfotelmatobacter sp.]
MSAAASFRRETPAGVVEGGCAPAFMPVAEEFVRNFTARGEVGASLALTLEGRIMVDLWGGLADPASKRPWQRDTVSIVFSCTKGATALCAHVLSARGKLDIDAPVCALWPEFARHGKDGATTRMMLDHSVAVPVLREKLKPGAFYDWDYMTGRLADETPFWQPGTRNGYHALTFGFTVGEMVRRAAGTSLGSFFQEAIARPLGIDFWIGLPEAEEPRVAPMIVYRAGADEQVTPFLSAALNERGSVPNLMVFNSDGFRERGANSRAGHAAEIGAANGITNGRGLAGLYAPLANGGKLDGVSLVDADTLARMGEVSMATHLDATLMLPTRFALGFMKSMDNRKNAADSSSVILGASAFGHVGAGGSIGFADPACAMSFGYSMNRMGPGIVLNARGQSLVDAAYRCLGYRSNQSGVWAR